MDESNLDAGTSRTVGGPIEQVEDSAKRFVLAGIGAVATAYDSAEETFDRFVRRGQEVQDEWRDRTDEARREARRQNMTARGRVRDSWRMMMETVLDSFNVPTKTEVDAMNVKLNVMMRKLDDIALQREVEPNPGQPEVPSSDVPLETPDDDMAT